MNNKISEKEVLDEINKKEIKDKNENYINEINNVNNINKKSEKNLDYKEKYEELKRRKELLNTKIKELGENIISSDELKNTTLKEHEVLKEQFQQFTQNSAISEMKIQDLKNFINANVDKEKAQRFFKDLDIN